MKLPAREKKQCPVRLCEQDYEKISELAKQYGLSYQKVAEHLLLCFMRENKTIIALIQKYAEDKKARKGRTFDSTETGDILEKIEEVSPMRNF